MFHLTNIEKIISTMNRIWLYMYLTSSRILIELRVRKAERIDVRINHLEDILNNVEEDIEYAIINRYSQIRKLVSLKRRK